VSRTDADPLARTRAAEAPTVLIPAIGSALPPPPARRTEPNWARGLGVVAAFGLTVLTLLWLVHPPASAPRGARAADYPAGAGAVAPRSLPAGSGLDGGDGVADVRDAGNVSLAVSDAARHTISGVVGSVPDGAAAVAAADLTTGASVVQGSTKPIWTASLYKLLVLETLLRQGGPLSGSQLDQARIMIEQSDNEAGYALFEQAGGNDALRSTMKALGMTDSVADADDPTFTRLTASDALQLAHALVKPGPLSSASQQQALGLMRNVITGQRWGVGVVADRNTDFANKNGWLSVDDTNGGGNDDNGRWIVTSVGVMTVHGHQVIVAALTEHNADQQDGIDAVETMARAAVRLLGD
jgi:beta-lactamase class A